MQGKPVARFRRPAAGAWIVLGMCVMLLIPLSGIIAGGHGAEPSLAQRLICSVLSVVAAVLVVRVARMSIVATTEGVILRNPVHTNFVPWSRIASFGVPARYGAVRNAGLRVELTDGSLLTAAAFCRGPFDRADVGVAAVEELEALRREYSG